jgi:hypothetical protein
MSWVAIGVSLAGTAASVGGNLLASRTAANATGTAEAQRIQGANIEAQDVGQGQNVLGQVAQENAPGQTYLRGVVAGSNDLTPEQQLRLNDIRQQESTMLRGGPLSGSGRATAGMIDDQQNRFVIGALDTNRKRADAAAAGMATRAYGADTARAADWNTIGRGFATAYGGNATDTAALGRTEGNAITASANSIGTAIGNVGSAISRSNRLRQASDTYAPATGGSDVMSRASSYDTSP